MQNDALVVGGGLAGVSVALELARAGRRTILLEKTGKPHDKVCGEFLSREALHYLKHLRVDVRALGAVSIRRVRLLLGDAAVETQIPFAAASLSRRRLDEEMLRLAAEAGVEVHRGSAVHTLQKTAGQWVAGRRDATEIQAKEAFLATGKHDLHDLPRPSGTHNGLVGFKMYYRLQAQQQEALKDAVELILFPGGYAGLQPVEDGRANLCLLVTAKRLRACGSGWPGLLEHMLKHAPLLARRLGGATALLSAPLAITAIPYGHLQMPSDDELWRVGDQAAVIPSFCGDGMAIALHSGALAAKHLLSGCSPRDFHRTLQDQLRARLWFATKLSQLMVEFPSAAQAVRLLPPLLGGIALMTRIPHRALLNSTVQGG